MPQRLPRFYAAQQRIEDERRLAKIILEAEDAGDESDAPALTRRSADGHDWQRRRGLPLIGRGTSGAMPGTNPLAALVAKESGRR